jgi:hypothetical protein
MRKTLTFLSMAAVLAAAVPSPGADHLVSSQTAEARLLEAAAARRGHLEAVEGALASPSAVAAAAAVGADLGRLRAALPTLSDAELAELGVRAAALQADPVASLDSDIKLLLMIFLIVAIVILVLQAVD